MVSMMLATQKGQGRPRACPQNDEVSGCSPGSWRPRSSSVLLGMMVIADSYKMD